MRNSRGKRVAFKISKLSAKSMMAAFCLPGACFSKVPMINGPGKLSPFSLKIEVSIVLHVT